MPSPSRALTDIGPAQVPVDKTSIAVCLQLSGQILPAGRLRMKAKEHACMVTLSAVRVILSNMPGASPAMDIPLQNFNQVQNDGWKQFSVMQYANSQRLAVSAATGSACWFQLCIRGAMHALHCFATLPGPCKGMR